MALVIQTPSSYKFYHPNVMVGFGWANSFFVGEFCDVPKVAIIIHI
jgi:hypothetical protein